MIAGLAAVVLARAGVVPWRVPRGTMGVVLRLSVLAVVANAATPSGAERALWLPVTVALLAAASVVAWGSGATRADGVRRAGGGLDGGG